MQAVKARMEDWLIKLGMFPDQAHDVLVCAMDYDGLSLMKGHWSKQAAHYPDSVLQAAFVHVKIVAAKWVDEHDPDA